MLASRLDVLRQLHAEMEADESRDVPLLVGSLHGVVEVRFVALREKDNVLVVGRHAGGLAFIPLDFVRSSWREQRPNGTLHRVRVTRVGWRRLVQSPTVKHARSLRVV